MTSSDEDTKNSGQEPQSQQDVESVLPPIKDTTALSPSQSQALTGEAREEVKEADHAQLSEAQEAVLEEAQWRKKTIEWIRNVNGEGADKVVEVSEDGTFLAGDVELAKGDDDEFELYIIDAKPGVWRMSHSVSFDDESCVQFIWVREGTVDYDALPPPSSNATGPAADDDAIDWEELGTFSVDSGVAGLFSQSVFNALTFEGDRQYKIEILLDAPIEGLGGPYVPGGIIVRGNDGGYVVEGTRDEDGKIVLMRMHEY